MEIVGPASVYIVPLPSMNSAERPSSEAFSTAKVTQLLMSIKTRPLFSYELETVVLISFLSLMPLFILKNCRPPASEVSEEVEEFMLHGQITHGLEARGGARM